MTLGITWTWLLGCAALEEFSPTVRYDQMEVMGISWEAVDSQFHFAVNNPNPLEIKLKRFDYALDFEGVEWLTGDNPDGLVLAADGDSQWSLPAVIDFTTLYEVIQAMRGEDVIDFALSGSFGFDTPLGPVDLPYDTVGDFPALRTPQFQLHKLELGEIDWMSMSIDAGLYFDVDNDHGSTLSFWNMDYGISIAGTEVTQGFLSDMGEVEGSSSRRVELPFTIDLLSLGTAAYDLIVHETPGRVTLDTSMDVDTPFGSVPLSLQIADGALTLD